MLSFEQFAELLFAFIRTRAEVIDAKQAAHVVIDRRFNVPRYGWPLVTDEARGRIMRRDLVIALLACADVVRARPEIAPPAFLERFLEPHPVATSRGPRAPDGPGDVCTCGACAWCDRLEPLA